MISKPSCGECKHWEPPFQGGKYGDCSLTEHYGEKLQPERLAYAMDSEDNYSVLRTQATFCCCLWELRI